MKKVVTALSYEVLIHQGMLWKNEGQHLHAGIVATMMCGIGFAPIMALALSIMGFSTLPFAALVLVIPAVGFAIGLSYYRPGYGRLMRHGFLMGIIAVTCYDCVRIPFTMAGWMNDFMPRIGGMLIDDRNHHALIGYLWRYIGNGGGMGMAFVCAFALLKPCLTESLQARMTPSLTKLIGMGFGVFVWACLIATLKISDQDENSLFVISPTSLLLSLIGHLVFGYTLGCLVNRFKPERIRC